MDISPGVPLALAEHRAATISDVDYELSFTIPAERSEPIAGEATIDFMLAAADAPVVLDFDGPPGSVSAVTISGDPVEYTHADEHIVIPAGEVAAGLNVIRISFTAGDDPLNRQEEFLYTLLVPDRARRAFPAFDQPDLKATFTLTVHVPEGWTAVANGFTHEVAAEEPTPDGPGGETYRFAKTAPISTYLFAFAAGRFQVEESEHDGRTLRLFHRETDSTKVARNLEAIFDLHATAIEWLEDYTGLPYPFYKFDFVAVPSFQYGGMEHPGSIFYRDGGLFLEESATQNQYLGRASLIAHETAHMWFGDLVTMKWFDDVWMKEVFANFMAAKIVHPSFPEIDHELRFLIAHYPSAYAVDRTAGANPIRQPLDNLANAGTLYGAIIYQKAPIVMRQLELLIGEQAMRDGLREYLETYAFGNATWPDLIEILDRRSDENLAEWSRVWVTEPGRPTIGFGAVAVDDGDAPGRGRRLTAVVEQEDPRGRGLLWTQPLEIRLGGASGASAQAVPVQLSGARTEIAAGLDEEAGDWALLNGAGVGYGRFRMTPEQRAWFLAHLWELTNPTERAVAWLGLWDAMLEGEVPPEALIETGIRAIDAETEELLVPLYMGNVGTAYWRFLSTEARTGVAPRLEDLLWRKVEEAESLSLKSTFFRGYRAIALTAAATERLADVWKGELLVAGLPLDEPNRIALARALAVREAEGWTAILAEQLEQIDNPDRRARFEFVRPALDADRRVRDSWFASLTEAENRAREPWVLEGLGALHHPLRTSGSVEYILPSLELLEEIQGTGDIFFPKRWLDATLGGHSSPEAAGIVRDFLAGRPDYPVKLRAKILQSADMLDRSAAVRTESGASAATSND